MDSTPLLSALDRERGWMDLEVVFTDGSREAVRVHFLEQSDVLALAKLSPADAMQQALMKMLRQDANYVARLHGTSKLMVASVFDASISMPGEEQKTIREAVNFAAKNLEANG